MKQINIKQNLYFFFFNSFILKKKENQNVRENIFILNHKILQKSLPLLNFFILHKNFLANLLKKLLKQIFFYHFFQTLLKILMLHRNFFSNLLKKFVKKYFFLLFF